METENTNNKKDLITDQINLLRQIEIEGYQIGVKKARNALFWVAGLILAGELFSMYRSGTGFSLYVLVYALIVAGFFTGLAFWTKARPYTALLIGLIGYIAYILLVIAVNGMAEGAGGFLKAALSGIIVRAVIIIILVRGIPDARKLQEAIKEEAL